MDAMKRDFLSTHAPDWTTDGLGTLICPCGNRVEDDGQCPNGHVSPMKELGFI